MVIYFSIYCLLGFFMESVYVSILQRKWIASGLLKGPFIPLYGVGACLLIVLSPDLHQSIWLSFFIGGCAMTLLEYFTSLLIEKCFHTHCWDYSHHFCQFQGRVCLLYFFIWCSLSYAFIFYIHPFIVSLNLVCDSMCIICLIYIVFLLKAFIDKVQFQKTNGLDIH